MYQMESISQSDIFLLIRFFISYVFLENDFSDYLMFLVYITNYYNSHSIHSHAVMVYVIVITRVLMIHIMYCMESLGLSAVYDMHPECTCYNLLVDPVVS